MMLFELFIKLVNDNYRETDITKNNLLIAAQVLTETTSKNIALKAIDITPSLFQRFVELLNDPIYKKLDIYFFQVLLNFITLYNMHNSHYKNRYNDSLNGLFNAAITCLTPSTDNEESVTIATRSLIRPIKQEAIALSSNVLDQLISNFIHYASIDQNSEITTLTFTTLGCYASHARINKLNKIQLTLFKEHLNTCVFNDEKINVDKQTVLDILTEELRYFALNRHVTWASSLVKRTSSELEFSSPSKFSHK